MEGDGKMIMFMNVEFLAARFNVPSRY